MDSSSITGEHQSNASSNPEGEADRTTSADGDHPHHGRKGRGNADSGQPRIEPPDNRENFPQNRECPGAVGYGRPPVASRFRRGPSGNPGGRPRKLVVTERYAEMLDTRLPPVQRRQKEQEIGMKLPKNFTIVDAIALNAALEATKNLKAAREIREAAEGTATPRIWALEPPTQDSRDERQKDSTRT